MLGNHVLTLAFFVAKRAIRRNNAAESWRGRSNSSGQWTTQAGIKQHIENGFFFLMPNESTVTHSY